MSEFLIDTNILVYVHDPRDRHKQERSSVVVDRLAREGAAVLSVQCLTEFYRTVRWKLDPPMAPNHAIRQVEHLMKNCRVLPLTPTAALDAMRATGSYSLSFWDALIWAVAREAGVDILLTEDFEDGQVLEGVRFVNPFLDMFDMSVLPGGAM